MTKFARYEADGAVSYGIVEGDTIKQITAAPYEDYSETGTTRSVSAVKLLAPVVPSKVVAIGLNYRSHLGERAGPKVPEPFFKVPTSVIGPGDAIVIPHDAIAEGVNVQPEAEMSIVIGKTCRKATKENALSFILGYTCGNDISARDWQRNDLQWWRAKSSDTFTPLGPYIVTDMQHDDMHLVCRVNGEVVQEQNTSDLLHDTPSIIEFVSRVLTLLPGDVIMTGTPGTPGNIHKGDVVEVEIDGIGVLTNPVDAED